MTTEDRTPLQGLTVDSVPRCPAVALVVRGTKPTLWRCDSFAGDHQWHESHYVLGGETGSYGWSAACPVLTFHANGTFEGHRESGVADSEAITLAERGELNAAGYWLDEIAKGLRAKRVHGLADELRASADPRDQAAAAGPFRGALEAANQWLMGHPFGPLVTNLLPPLTHVDESRVSIPVDLEHPPVSRIPGWARLPFSDWPPGSGESELPPLTHVDESTPTPSSWRTGGVTVYGTTDHVVLLPTDSFELGELDDWLSYATASYMSPATRGWLERLREAVKAAIPQWIIGLPESE